MTNKMYARGRAKEYRVKKQLEAYIEELIVIIKRLLCTLYDELLENTLPQYLHSTNLFL